MSQDNHYYQVTRPFAIEVRVGLTEAFVWIGRSQALQDLYETITVHPGDEIHALLGGNFLVRHDIAYAFDTRRHQASELILHPGPRDPELPLDCLVEISPTAACRPAATYRSFEFTVGSPPIRVAP